MKVTVCFGAMRILVPCGNGDLLVRELINEAIRRYMRASAKKSTIKLTINHLSTQAGILDPDDCLRDVADDREEIQANFVEGEQEVAAVENIVTNQITNNNEQYNTKKCFLNRICQQMRRRSDSNIFANLKADKSNNNNNKALISPPLIRVVESPEQQVDEPIAKSANDFLPKFKEFASRNHQRSLKLPKTQPQQQQQPQQQPFQRHKRLSMQFLNDGTGYKWLDSSEKLQNQLYIQRAYQHAHYRSSCRSTSRFGVVPEAPLVKEWKRQQQKLLQNSQNFKDESNESHLEDTSLNGGDELRYEEEEILSHTVASFRQVKNIDCKIEIVLKKGSTGLGFSVTTCDNPTRGISPIYVKNIAASGAAIEDGRLKSGDRILEIDGIPIMNKTQSEVVAFLRALNPGVEVHFIVSRVPNLSKSV